MSNLADHLAEQDEITAAHEAANDLGMACPKCGQIEAFHISASVWGRYTTEGFDPDAEDICEGGSDWDQYAGCICPACQHTGVVEDFTI